MVDPPIETTGPDYHHQARNAFEPEVSAYGTIQAGVVIESATHKLTAGQDDSRARFLIAPMIKKLVSQTLQ